MRGGLRGRRLRRLSLHAGPAAQPRLAPHDAVHERHRHGQHRRRGKPLIRPTVAHLPWLLAALAVAFRLPYCTAIAQDPDGARFARALLRFDLVQGHPHPPGYPLFIALGAVLHRLGAAPAFSLSLVSALSLGALVALIASWSRPYSALGAVLLVVVPLGTVLSARPLSDMLGAALAWGALYAATRPAPDARRVAVLSALVALVRVSTLALCLPALGFALARDRRRAPAALALALAVVAVGYAPVVASVGPSRFAALVSHHATGHFERFGGSIVTQPDLAARAHALLWSLWTQALGGGWSDRPAHLYASGALTLAVCVLGMAVARSLPGARVVAASGAFYLAWVFVGQNVLWSPRHLLPLVPLLALAFSVGASALSRRWPRAAPLVLSATLASLAVESVRLSRVQRDQPPPTIAVGRWLSAHADPGHTVVATAQLGPWLRALAPPHLIVDVLDAVDVERIRRATRDRVLVTSEVRGAYAPGSVVRARFVRDRYVTPALYDVAIIEQPR